MVVVAAALAVVPFAYEASPAAFSTLHEDEDWPLEPGREKKQRDEALKRLKVWKATDPASFDFTANPPDPSGLLSNAAERIVRCRYVPTAPRATTPKFDCALSNGDVVKVKYGWATAEVRAEVAASHLLAALGFGADQMFFVPRLRCFGCPRFPFEVTQVLDWIGLREAIVSRLPPDRFVDFEWVAVERRFAGREIVAGDDKGWSWGELERVDPAAGATRAELDALRVVARFLSHWDNKSANQRLVCVAAPGRGACPQPFALIHDLGATFGPEKIDLAHWEATRIWADAAGCRISMRDMPYDGGTFPDVTISEAGRALAARQLGALSDSQITDLFEAAHFSSFRGWHLRSWPVAEWVRAFHAKVDEVRSAGPCAGS
jgi:hypothetical protein